jgi:hypothetical protein
MKVLDKKLDTDNKPQTQKNIGFIYGKMEGKLSVRGDIFEPIDVEWEVMIDDQK